MLNFKELENGDLEVSAIDPEEFKEMIEHGMDYRTMVSDAFEATACNGSYTWFSGNDGNPYVGMTSAPCIAPSLDYNDDGMMTIPEQYFWYLNNYATILETHEWADGKSVVYTRFSQA